MVQPPQPTSRAGNDSPGRTSGPPSNARAIVIVFAVTLAVLHYIDRVAISQAAPLVSRDLGLTKEQMSWVFSDPVTPLEGTAEAAADES